VADGRYSTGPDGRGRRRAAPPIVDVVARAGADPSLVLADWQTVRIRTALGIALRQTSRVYMRRPGWMPRRLFRWLMRSIIIDVAPIDQSPVLLTDQGDHRARRSRR
jgi:hypothetical protein